MTDLAMDLMLANAEISKLKDENATLKKSLELLGKKCDFGAGVVVKPDGVNELDPCRYELLEKHTNVTVEVLRCKKCGHVEILWHRQEDTIDEEGEI